MLEKELIKAGFNDKEAKVYLAALELGETNIGRIAKKSGVKRTTVYLAVEALKEKGYISSVKRGNKIVFFAEDPRTLSERMEENMKAVDRIMPELLSFTNLIDKKPKIRYFEGRDGIMEIYKDILKYPNREVCSWFSKTAFDFDEQYFLDYFTPKRVEKKIWVRALLADSPEIRKIIEKYDKTTLKTSKLIASEKFKMPIDLFLYTDNKIGIISFEENIGVLIESKKIYESLKGIFEVMWELL